MDFPAMVKKSAGNLDLLDEQGQLIPLDSLMLMDLVTELETVTKVRIPTAAIDATRFKDLDAIANLLRDLSE